MGDADIAWPVSVCVCVLYMRYYIREPQGLYRKDDFGTLPAKWHCWRHLFAHVYSGSVRGIVFVSLCLCFTVSIFQDDCKLPKMRMSMILPHSYATLKVA